MLSEALRAPLRADDTVQTIIVGAVLSLVAVVCTAFFVFSLLPSTLNPLFLVLGPLALVFELVIGGYYVRVTRVGVRGDEATPSLVRWGQLLKDGLGLFVVDAVYFLPAVLILLCGSVAATIIASLVSSYGSLVEGATLLLTVMYWLLYWYVRPAAVAVFAAERRLRPALAVRRVGRVAADGDYASGWLRGAAVTAVAVVVGGALSALLVGFAVWFVLRSVAYLLYGRGVASTLESVAARSETTDDVSASFPDRRPEVSASVQTGRTVRLDMPPSLTDGAGEIGAGADPGSMGTVDSDVDMDTDDDASVDTVDAADSDPVDFES